MQDTIIDNNIEVVLPQYVLKNKPSDFQVHECYILDQAIIPHNDIYLFLLKKAQFSTMDAIHYCSENMNIAKKDITYYGLKDEEAITQQLVCIKTSASNILEQIEKFNQNSNFNHEKFIKLTYLQNTFAPLKVGEVLSNCFLLTIRKLSENVIESLNKKKCHDIFFVNYFGCQRFGLPNEEPISHLIGLDVINKNYQAMLSKIKQQNNALGEYARCYQGTPADFYNNMDNRERNFFPNAYYSYLWNDSVKQLLIATGMPLRRYNEKNLTFLFPKKNRNFRYLPDQLTCTKVNADDSTGKSYAGSRPVFIQAFFYPQWVKEDENFPNYFKCQIKFVLPTSCYATMAIAQFFPQLMEMKGE